MPFLSESATLPPSGLVMAMLQGLPIGPDPRTLTSPIYDSIINQNFEDQECPEIHLNKGRRVLLLEEKTDKHGVEMAKIYIEHLGKGDDFTGRWVPLKYITKERTRDSGNWKNVVEEKEEKEDGPLAKL